MRTLRPGETYRVVGGAQDGKTVNFTGTCGTRIAFDRFGMLIPIVKETGQISFGVDGSLYDLAEVDGETVYLPVR